MSVSGDQLLRAADELARKDARLRAELRSAYEAPRFLPLLQRALETVEIHDRFSKAGRVAWKVLRALRVEGD
jgi:hypothetical protein